MSAEDYWSDDEFMFEADPEYFGDYRDDDWVEAPKVCRACGMGGLYWINTHSGWKLGTNDKPHLCNPMAKIYGAFKK